MVNMIEVRWGLLLTSTEAGQYTIESILSRLQYRSAPWLQPVEGTCEWVFDSLPIRKLRGVNGHKMLWIHGSPGTVLNFIKHKWYSEESSWSDSQ